MDFLARRHALGLRTVVARDPALACALAGADGLDHRSTTMRRAYGGGLRGSRGHVLYSGPESVMMTWLLSPNYHHGPRDA